MSCDWLYCVCLPGGQRTGHWWIFPQGTWAESEETTTQTGKWLVVCVVWHLWMTVGRSVTSDSMSVMVNVLSLCTESWVLYVLYWVCVCYRTSRLTVSLLTYWVCVCVDRTSRQNMPRERSRNVKQLLYPTQNQRRQQPELHLSSEVWRYTHTLVYCMLHTL